MFAKGVVPHPLGDIDGTVQHMMLTTVAGVKNNILLSLSLSPHPTPHTPHTTHHTPHTAAGRNAKTRVTMTAAT